MIVSGRALLIVGWVTEALAREALYLLDAGFVRHLGVSACSQDGEPYKRLIHAVQSRGFRLKR